MKISRYLMIFAFGLALICLTTSIFSAEDQFSFLEAKKPAVKEVVANPSLIRESKFPRLPLNKKQIEFLIDNPRVALALAHLYASFLDGYRLELMPERVIHISDSDKLAGDAELVDVSPGRRGYFIAGYFEVLKLRFYGKMVLLTGYSEQRTDERVSVEATTTAYIKIDSVLASAFARLADFLFPKKVDARIERFVRAAETIVAEVHKDPQGAYKKLKAAGEVSPDELADFDRTFIRERS